MYNPSDQREPSGCVEALFYARIVLGTLLIPFVLILGTIFSLLLTIVAFIAHPLLGLLSIAMCVSAIAALARWEAKRIAREFPSEDQDRR